MRLIDADALNELLEHHKRMLLYNVKHGNSNKIRDFIMGVEDGYYRVQSDIKWIPTVDAVKVVRCKDCRWHEREQPGMVYCPNTVGNWVEDDWYCKGGERKGEEDG